MSKKGIFNADYFMVEHYEYANNFKPYFPPDSCKTAHPCEGGRNRYRYRKNGGAHFSDNPRRIPCWQFSCNTVSSATYEQKQNHDKRGIKHGHQGVADTKGHHLF
jgi:hypothetical protein